MYNLGQLLVAIILSLAVLVATLGQTHIKSISLSIQLDNKPRIELLAERAPPT